MTYRIAYTPQVLKQLKKLDRQTVRRVKEFFDRLDRSNPRSLGKALVGQDFWRYRIGDHRILVSIQDDVLTVLVVKVAHRREVYKER